MLDQDAFAGASRASTPSSNAAEIVLARKISRKTAQAAPVTHYRSHSKSNSVELRKHTQSSEIQEPLSGSPRIMPSPVPPPTAALPPTPGLNAAASPTLGGREGLSYRNSNASSFAASSIRKTFRHLSAGLTAEEHRELVHKILGDLRPASTTIRPFSRASRPTSSYPPSTASMAPEHKEPVEEIADAGGKRLSASSQGTANSQESHASDEKLGMSHSSISPATTPASGMSRINTSDKTGGESTDSTTSEQKALLTPTDALESLRVLENGFERSMPNSPLDATFTKDSKLSHTTAVASPTNAGMPPAPKRNSSYRKSVPTLEELAGKRPKDASSAASSVRAASPSTANTETPSWISSLTTLEAIRVLAAQQPTESSASTTSAVPAVSGDEVSALRYALTFTLARADKLAEALHRVSEDKAKVESELDILRRNVLSMLGSKNMFGGASPSSHGHDRSAYGEITEEDDADDHFVDARARQTPVPTDAAPVNKPQTPQPRAPAQVQPQGRGAAIARPARAVRAGRPAPLAAATTATTAAAVKPSGGVSIASLRKNAAAAGGVPPAAQRYTPRSRASGADDADAFDTEDEEEDDEFDMYPFGAPVRRALPEVSMTDFLNASRMSKTEIDEHDARRELERDESADFYASSSTSSHARLTSSSSTDHRRGFFKGITKLVDTERAKRSNRRASLVTKHSAPSLASRDAGMGRSASTNTIVRNMPTQRFGMAYQEESIIPAYPASGRDRQKTVSLSNSLRESLERQSLREAGIRA